MRDGRLVLEAVIRRLPDAGCDIGLTFLRPQVRIRCHLRDLRWWIPPRAMFMQPVAHWLRCPRSGGRPVPPPGTRNVSASYLHKARTTRGSAGASRIFPVPIFPTITIQKPHLAHWKRCRRVYNPLKSAIVNVIPVFHI